eukprot:CAMPEP_0119047688 /NCGR_PEP_ID=MMETSP1177-20130426/54448_1 /TAXON_ID=2985 /ORGANISM="Ochromonas sp, Strain CCMP1899" /LENGTH=147 /DNA_ID=CAMNT_0007022547 /DNA_START=401 /DNA_END=844 /DNA_ORIENTATION=-
MYVIYNDEIPLKSKSLDLNTPHDGGADYNPSPASQGNDISKVTHIKLVITPLDYITPRRGSRKVFLFEVSSFTYLIGPTDIEGLLKQSSKEVSLFLKRVCGVFRYEHTTLGLKLVVVGATLLPEHLYILNDKIVLPEDYDVIGEDGD